MLIYILFPHAVILPHAKVMFHKLQQPRSASIDSKILHYENIMIEVVGSWIWLSGDTKHIKETQTLL